MVDGCQVTNACTEGKLNQLAGRNPSPLEAFDKAESSTKITHRKKRKKKAAI